MTKRLAAWIVGASVALGNVGHAEASETFWDWFFSVKRMKEVAPVNDAAYNEECGSCHFPYQPGFLPAASWQKLLDAKALADHFGDSAELDETTRKHLLEFAVANSAEKSYYKRARKVIASLKKGDAPLRITDVPYIKDKHGKLPAQDVKDNPKVKSLSYCNKCHLKAEEATFDDDTVAIPGKGPWSW